MSRWSTSSEATYRTTLLTVSAPAAQPLTEPKIEALTDAAPDTDVDAALLAAAWDSVERFSQRLWLPAASGNREVVAELDVLAGGVVPRGVDYRRTPGLTVDAVAKWDSDTDAYAAAASTDWSSSPRGICLQHGEWRVTWSATPDAAVIPEGVLTATRRVYAYLYHHAPARQADEFGGGNPPNLANAIRNSGAGSLLRPYMRVA